MSDILEAAKHGIQFHSLELVKALECAETAASAGMHDMAASFRRYAALCANNAWAWVPRLAPFVDAPALLTGNTDIVCEHATLGAQP